MLDAFLFALILLKRELLEFCFLYKGMTWDSS